MPLACILQWPRQAITFRWFQATQLPRNLQSRELPAETGGARTTDTGAVAADKNTGLRAFSPGIYAGLPALLRRIPECLTPAASAICSAGTTPWCNITSEVSM
jgi:hypothetical protein